MKKIKFIFKEYVNTIDWPSVFIVGLIANVIALFDTKTKTECWEWALCANGTIFLFTIMAYLKKKSDDKFNN